MKKIIIAMIIFLAISVGITTGLILIKNSTTNDKVIPNDNNNLNVTRTNYRQNINDDTPGIDLYETYDDNSIIWEQIKIDEGTIIGEYYQIKGLKDKEVEEKINKILENELLAKAKEYEKREDVEKIWINQYKYASFANVISTYNSIAVSLTEKDEHGYNKYLDIPNTYTNLELITGNKIKFEELFTKNADILSIIKEKIYENLAWSEYSNNINWDEQYDPEIFESLSKNIAIDEDKYIQLIQKFKTTEEIKFYFNPISIYVDFEDEFMQINMKDCYNDIAIYNRFLTQKTIYESNDIGRKNIINLTIKYGEEDIVFEEMGFIEDNLYVDITIYNSYYGDETYKEKAQDKCLEEIKKRLDSKIEFAKDNPNKKMYYFETANIANDTYWNESTITIYHGFETYEMASQKFDKEFYPMLLERYREESSSEYYDSTYREKINIDDSVIYEDDSFGWLYSKTEDKLIIEAKDYFVEGYDYETVIKTKLKEAFKTVFNVELDEETLEKEYEITKIYCNGWDNFMCANENIQADVYTYKGQEYKRNEQEYLSMVTIYLKEFDMSQVVVK